MKNFTVLVILLSTLIVFTNCKKDCKIRSASREEPQILAFAAANGIIASKHSSGLYYQIIDSGSGIKPTVNSQISITYTGKLLNGVTFDERTTPNNTILEPAWPLKGLIEGWQIGIPLIGEGGRIKLIVPSSQAYGCEDYYTIPGNSILYFDITLYDVQ
ncbi:MAG: FKBP-type peptidyl-prolyl cis-trans isomerase [Chitinophagaceae bacterium]